MAQSPAHLPPVSEPLLTGLFAEDEVLERHGISLKFGSSAQRTWACHWVQDYERMLGDKLASVPGRNVFSLASFQLAGDCFPGGGLIGHDERSQELVPGFLGLALEPATPFLGLRLLRWRCRCEARSECYWAERFHRDRDCLAAALLLPGVGLD